MTFSLICDTIVLYKRKRVQALETPKLALTNERDYFQMAKANKGREFSEEFCRRMSELNSGENHPNFGKPRSEETRRRVSESKKGKQQSEDHRRKNSEAKTGENNPNFGKHLSAETRQKISEANKGKKHTDATKLKISETKKRNKLVSPEET